DFLPGYRIQEPLHASGSLRLLTAFDDLQHRDDRQRQNAVRLPIGGGIWGNGRVDGFEDFRIDVGIEQRLIHRERASTAAPGDIWGHPQFPLATGQTTPYSVRLTIMTLAWSRSDLAKASQAHREHTSMARRNRAEVVVADEVGVYHCVQRVVRRAFLCGVDPLSGNSTIIAEPGFGTAWSRWPGSSAWRS